MKNRFVARPELYAVEDTKTNLYFGVGPGSENLCAALFNGDHSMVEEFKTEWISYDKAKSNAEAIAKLFEEWRKQE